MKGPLRRLNEQPHLALIIIRRFSDFFREPLDQLSIFFRGNAASSDSGRAARASRFMTGWRKPALTPHGHWVAELDRLWPDAGAE